MRDHVLDPYSPEEAIGIAEASARSNLGARQMREWCMMYGIGRKIGGRWQVSAPALDMLHAGDFAALEAYQSGDRRSGVVVTYFERRGIPVPVAEAVHGATPVESSPTYTHKNGVTLAKKAFAD